MTYVDVIPAQLVLSVAEGAGIYYLREIRLGSRKAGSLHER